MTHLLARFGAGPGTDHRAVFHAFAERLARALARTSGEARVRVVRG